MTQRSSLFPDAKVVLTLPCLTLFFGQAKGLSCTRAGLHRVGCILLCSHWQLLLALQTLVSLAS